MSYYLSALEARWVKTVVGLSMFKEAAIFRKSPGILLTFLVMAMALPAVAPAVPLERSVGGSDGASIQATVNQFRVDLGGVNNGNTIGPLPTGRREIGWDGGGAAALFGIINPATFNTPPTTRGAVFSTPGTGVAISGAPDPEFSNLNPTYLATFTTFSAPRLFSPLDSNIVDQVFFVPGTNIPALTSGFGAVFTDVDLQNSTSIEYFDVNNASLGIFNVLAGTVADESLSFLGVSFGSPIVSRVRITSGTAALGPNDNPGGGVDVVVMDDFIYGEPQAIPAPATLSLLGIGLAGLGVLIRRRNWAA